MDWRGWNLQNPCPKCGGYGFAGKSAEQCAGGYFPERPSTAWCGQVDSGRPSPSGKTWRHELPAPYEWQGEAPQQRSSEGSSRYPAAWPPGVDSTWEWVTSYEYQGPPDHEGKSWPWYWVARFAPADRSTKTFRPFGHTSRNHDRAIQRSGDARWRGYGQYLWGYGPLGRIPYRLPQLLAAIKEGRALYLCEGEKDADAGAARFPEAAFTTLPGGAGVSWQAEYLHWFEGALEVSIITHRDDAGRAHARRVAQGLAVLVPTIRLVQAREGNDLHDHLEAGHQLDNLEPVPA